MNEYSGTVTDLKAALENGGYDTKPLDDHSGTERVVRVRPIVFTHEELAQMIEDRLRADQPEIYQAAHDEDKDLIVDEFMLEGKFCGLVARWE